MIRTALIVAALATPVTAQSFDEAVRQNLALGISICVQHVGDPARARGMLEAAGYAYAGFDGPAEDATHRYAAPARTVEVLIYDGQTAPFCHVETNHLTPGQAGQITGGVLQGVAPGKFAPTPAECPNWTEIGPPLPLTVGVSDLGNGGGCPEASGARIFFFFAV